MAFLVWSRKDGRKRPITAGILRPHWGGIVTLCHKPLSPHQVPTYWDNSARRRLPAEPR